MEEYIYDDLDIDVEEVIERVLNMSVEEIEKQTPEIIGKFPNTYTFTKNLSEKLIRKNRGDTPTVILRPSIIGAGYTEPLTGWTDALSAAGAIYLLSLIGLMNDMMASTRYIGD